MRFHKTILFLLMVFFLLGAITYVHAENSETKEEYITVTSSLNAESMEAYSNRQTHLFDTDKVDNFLDVDGFSKIAETDIGELWLNERWNTIRVKNKNTGYIWGALVPEKAEGLNKTWNNYGNSITAIECFDGAGIEKRYSMTSDATVAYTLLEDGFLCYADFTEIGISFEVTVRFHGNKLSFAVDENSIVEGKDDSAFRLKSIIFLPYLGAVYSDSVDGYMLIPDGPGALIRFQKPAQYSSTYAARVYGKDLGIESLSSPSDLRAFRPNDYIVEEPQILMPVYGVVHGAYQNGLFAVIDKGAEYASILATPALLNNPYNWIGARFEYRQKYIKNINRKEGAGAVVPQEHRNEISPELSVYLLDGTQAHYDGMAVFYRDLLEKQGKIEGSVTKKEALPLRIEVLGADYHDEFLGKSLRVFTTIKETSNIVEELSKGGITNLSLIYKCYTKNNEASNSLINKIGDKEDYRLLSEQVTANGGRFYYYLNPLTANRDQITQRIEAANNLSNMVIKITRNNNSLLYPDTYFYRLSEVQERIQNILNSDDYSEPTSFALDQLSYRLFGDFTSGKEKTRAQSLKTVIEMVEQITKGEAIPMYMPNQYLWDNTLEFYNAPLSSAQFLYETDTVPFLQIVLNSKMQLFSTPFNTGMYSKERILRHIEYGVAPSFVITDCESIDLYKTAQQDYFSTNFNDWENLIYESYQMISEALAPLQGQKIMNHVVLEEGFIRTTYENGLKIYVNYTGTEKTDKGITVEPSWYRVIR